MVDTREQESYTFDPGLGSTVRRALPAGDYSVEGLEQVVAVERKSMNDFISTVIHARSRFRNELRRLGGYKAACVVVEGNLGDVLRGKYHGAAHPNSVLGSCLSIILDFRVPVFFCSDRQAACRFVEAYLVAAHSRNLR